MPLIATEYADAVTTPDCQVGLLGADAPDADRVLRCFVQFLESGQLIDAKPMQIGTTLLASIDGKEDYQRGVLLANIKKSDAARGAPPGISPGGSSRHGSSTLVRVLQLPDGSTIHTDLALPFGENDAGAVLRAAAAQGNEPVLSALLDAGVSPLHADENANTALHAAAEMGCVGSCERLLNHHGAKPLHHLQPAFISNRQGVRPYDWSLMGAHSGPELRSVLKRSEADEEVGE